MSDRTAAADIDGLMQAMGLDGFGGEAIALQLDRGRQLHIRAGGNVRMRLILPCPAWELAGLGVAALSRQDARMAACTPYHIAAVDDHLVISIEADAAPPATADLLSMAERLVAYGDRCTP